MTPASVISSPDDHQLRSVTSDLAAPTKKWATSELQKVWPWACTTNEARIGEMLAVSKNVTLQRCIAAVNSYAHETAPVFDPQPTPQAATLRRFTS